MDNNFKIPNKDSKLNLLPLNLVSNPDNTRLTKSIEFIPKLRANPNLNPNQNLSNQSLISAAAVKSDLNFKSSNNKLFNFNSTNLNLSNKIEIRSERKILKPIKHEQNNNFAKTKIINSKSLVISNKNILRSKKKSLTIKENNSLSNLNPLDNINENLNEQKKIEFDLKKSLRDEENIPLSNISNDIYKNIKNINKLSNKLFKNQNEKIIIINTKELAPKKKLFNSTTTNLNFCSKSLNLNNLEEMLHASSNNICVDVEMIDSINTSNTNNENKMYSTQIFSHKIRDHSSDQENFLNKRITLGIFKKEEKKISSNKNVFNLTSKNQNFQDSNVESKSFYPKFYLPKAGHGFLSKNNEEVDHKIIMESIKEKKSHIQDNLKTENSVDSRNKNFSENKSKSISKKKEEKMLRTQIISFKNLKKDYI
jgi:hypothetical protein